MLDHPLQWYEAARYRWLARRDVATTQVREGPRGRRVFYGPDAARNAARDRGHS